MKNLFQNNIFILIVLLSLLNIIWYWYFLYQPVIQVNGHHGFDGVHYYNMYHAFKENLLLKNSIGFPFNNRILTPWLASILPFDSLYSFRLINFVFMNLFFIISIYLYLYILKIKKYLIFLAMLWIALHWIGIIRLYIFHPFTVDVAVYMFGILFVYLIWTNKYVYLLLLAPLATLQKESFMALLFALFAYMICINILSWKKISITLKPYTRVTILYVFIAIILSIGVKYYTNHYIVETHGRGIGSSLLTLYSWGVRRLYNPFEITRWITAFFIGFGGMVALAMLNFKKYYTPSHSTNILLLFALIHIAFGLLAGSDMTRIMVLGFPYIMTLILLLTNQEKPLLLIIVFIVSLPLLQVLSKIPEPSIDMRKFENFSVDLAYIAVANGWTLLVIMIILAVLWIKKVFFNDPGTL